MFIIISAIIVAFILASMVILNIKIPTKNINWMILPPTGSMTVPNPPDFTDVREHENELIGDYKFFGKNNSLNGTSVVNQSDLTKYKKNMIN